MNINQRSDGTACSSKKYVFGNISYPRGFNFTYWTPEQLEAIGITLVPYVEPVIEPVEEELVVEG